MHRLHRYLLVASLAFAGATQALAANPYLPAWEYIPDGEPRLFGDRVYVYGSHDRAGSTRFCDFQLRVWSAPLSDLNNWTDHGISFATIAHEGHGDDVPWSDRELYAPDVVEKGGKYYLFAYIVGSPCAVAVSDSPKGPFKTIGQIKAPADAPSDFGGWGQYIDPGVLVDDDGKVFIYWGYQNSHLAQLDPATMVDVRPDTYQADIVPKEKPFNFFEACSPRRIGDTYYLVYADGSILVYLTSKSPNGPFTYGGPIIRNGRDYPGGNIHGGLVRLNGQWYIFYHRMTNNTLYSRQACAERITIKPDGSIDEVEMTSLGFEDKLDPYRTWSAHYACVLTGGNYITEFDRDTHPVVNNREGSVVGFKYFDFGTTTAGEKLIFTAAIHATGPGRITVFSGAADKAKGGIELGSAIIASHGEHPTDWQKITVEIPAPSGRQAIFVRFTSESGDKFNCELQSIAFQRH